MIGAVASVKYYQFSDDQNNNCRGGGETLTVITKHQVYSSLCHRTRNFNLSQRVWALQEFNVRIFKLVHRISAPLADSLSYILQKTPLKLVNWFQRYEQLKDAKNNRKQKTFSALFGSILKSTFSTSD